MKSQAFAVLVFLIYLTTGCQSAVNQGNTEAERNMAIVVNKNYSFNQRVEAFLRVHPDQEQVKRQIALFHRLYPNQKAEEYANQVCNKLKSGLTQNEVHDEGIQEIRTLREQKIISEEEISDFMIITSTIQTVRNCK
ncbi:MAG: hypothetical protein ACM37W_00240 [Actinomycetota bacterium]